MAEILFNFSSAHRKYAPGDPVVVKPDGWTWSEEERRPPAVGGIFWILKLPGRSVDRVKPYIRALLGTNNKRLWRIVWSELPKAVRDEITGTGEYTATWTQVRNFLENKTTMERASGA